MTSNRILRRLAFFVLAAPLVAQAAIITSVNRATFQSAVASQQIDQQNFDSLAAGTILGSLGGVTYSSSLGSPLVTSTFLTSTSPNGPTIMLVGLRSRWITP